jgi:hypothetical protein
MIDHMQNEREEIELLLPWYERGTLTPAEMRRVENHLAADPELRERLALIREEASETIASNESLGMPRAAARDRLMEQIAAEAGAIPAVSSSLRTWLSGLIPAGLSPGLAMTGATAALVIFVQAILLISLLSTDGGERGPRLASGQETSASTGTFVLIRFTENAQAKAIAGLLRSVKGTIVDGPKPGGIFKIRISDKVLPEPDRDAILNRLREDKAIVAFVAASQ